MNRRIARRGGLGVQERGFRFLEAAERAQRACAARQIAGFGRPRRHDRDAFENGIGVRPSEHFQQESEFERGVAGRRALGNRAERRLGFLILAARNRRARDKRGHGRILGVEFFDDAGHLIVPAFEKRAGRLFDRGRLGSARLGNSHGNDREHSEHGDSTDRLPHHSHII